MKIKNTLSILFSSCLLFGIWTHCKSLAIHQDNITQQELENYLKTASIGSDWKPIGRRTEAYVVNLDDGRIKRRGVLKLTDRTRPSHPIPDSYKYGIAAYELDRLLDLKIVPPTVVRETDGRKGSLMIFLEDSLRESDRQRKNLEPPDPKSFENALEEIKAFENLVYFHSLCGMKDLGNILIMVKEDWKVWEVDFSEAFVPRSELIPECPIIRISKKFYKNLMKMDDEEVKLKLKPYLNDEEIKALFERKNAIIKTIQQLIQEKGEDSVLFSRSP